MKDTTCAECGVTEGSGKALHVDERELGEETEVLCWRCYADRLEEESVLTGREAETWALKDSGLSAGDIAEVLGQKRGSVKSYWHRAKEKRDAAERTLELTDTELYS